MRWSSKAECSLPGKTEEVTRRVFPGRELACVSSRDRGQDGMCDEASAHCSGSTEFLVRRGRAVWREPKCRERRTAIKGSRFGGKSRSALNILSSKYLNGIQMLSAWK